MSCYFRHLQEVFKEAEIEVRPGNKKQIDQAIHGIVGVNYKDCSATWRKLKQEILSDEPRRLDFIARLREAVR
jgi:hypothetical protein